MRGRVLLLVVTAGSAFSQEVPFVGCASDGQTGPMEAPKGESPTLSITIEQAKDLAYYKAFGDVGVIGPRGWYCFGTYGSGGDVLYVSPTRIDSDMVFSDSSEWKGFAGPGIILTHEFGDTSGRFGVADMIARVFPAHRSFDEVRRIEPSFSFHFGPFPGDRLTYKTGEIVEYETRPNVDGLGTMSAFQRNSDSIRGVAMLLGKTPDLLLLAVRPPDGMKDLAPVIIEQVEREAAQAH